MKTGSNNNYRGEKLIKLPVQNVRDNGMSIADYLAAHNNPIPEDAKWFITDPTIIKRSKLIKSTQHSETEYKSEFVRGIDLRDPECRYQDIEIRNYNLYTNDLFRCSNESISNENIITNNCLTISKVFIDDKNPFGIMEKGKYMIGSGTYKLGKDLMIDGSITVQDGADVVIDLNGHRINRALTERENFGTAIVAGKNSKVTIIDSNPNGGGSITGGYDNNAGALHIYENAEVKVENVTFAGNHANKHGGAIFTKGSPELNNCTFTDNSGADGGAITNHGSLRVKGTSIFDGNSAKQNGGAIRTANYVEIDGATIVNNKTASRCRINYEELPYILFAAAFSVLEFRRKICYN